MRSLSDREYAFAATVDVAANQRGMTLRDYFAAQAVTGLVANGERYDSHLDMAQDAYAIADALMLARRAEVV